MISKPIVRICLSIGIIAASVIGIGSPAYAGASSFAAQAVHSDGAGALAAKATGGLAWYNRSVGTTGVKFYIKANECGYMHVQGLVGESTVDEYYYPPDPVYGEKSFGGTVCGGSTGKWYTVGDRTLDGSAYTGGITSVLVGAVDYTHGIHGWTSCLRSNSYCTSDQYAGY